MKKKYQYLILAIALSIGIVMSGCKKYENPADLPFGNSDWQKESTSEVIERLENAGFTNIQTIEKETSSASKDETVSRITVDGSDLFRKGTRYEEDVPIEITCFVLKQIDATMEVSTKGETGEPEFEVQTNLPAGVIVSMLLQNDEGYTEEKKVKVSDGKAVSEPFRDEMKKLVGSYQLTVTVKMQDQGATGKTELGENGECLSGTLMKEDADTGSRYLCFEYDYISDYEPDESVSDEEMRTILEQATALGFGNDYEIVTDDSGYTISVWTSETAATAALAVNGYEEPQEQWDTVLESLRKASISLQNCLEGNGHGDKIAVINLMNDVNHDYVLATAYNGAILYDCVSQ